MSKLSELSLKELRELYPEIKAVSKVAFLGLLKETEVPTEEVLEETEVPTEEVVKEVSEDTITADQLLEYIAENIPTRNKILIKCEDSLTADDLYLHCQYALFPMLNKKGISVLSSSTRRDMHLNGTCYVRISCKRNYDHLKRLMAYNTFKEVV